MKIYFSNNWGENDEKCMFRIKKTTPNDNGIWKNISCTYNLNEADYVVCLGGLNRSLKFPLQKIITLQREPLVINGFNTENKLHFPYTKLHHAWTDPQFINLNYDEIKKIKYEEKKLHLSTITSMKLHTVDAKKRVNFIKNFCKRYPNVMDVYGRQWDGSLGSSYKGCPKTKYYALENYKYSLCIENSCYDNYFTEKITDCLLGWTIPIYFGCTNIDTYFPRDSYIWLDINEPKSIDKLYEIIQNPLNEKNIIAMEKARNLILEKYNIWELVNNIVNNDSKN